MKTYKTPTSKRTTYKLYDDNGSFVTEYKPGKDGVTEEAILFMHRLDDAEVRVNIKENHHPEWYQPVYDKWKADFVCRFREQYGRDPKADEIPGRFRQCESIDAQSDADGNELGECSRLESELSISDEKPDDAVTVMREIVFGMPKQWQQVYRLVFLEDMSKNKAGQIIGISDVRVGQLVKKIKAELAQNSKLKSFFR